MERQAVRLATGAAPREGADPALTALTGRAPVAGLTAGVPFQRPPLHITVRVQYCSDGPRLGLLSAIAVGGTTIALVGMALGATWLSGWYEERARRVEGAVRRGGEAPARARRGARGRAARRRAARRPARHDDADAGPLPGRHLAQRRAGDHRVPVRRRARRRRGDRARPARRRRRGRGARDRGPGLLAGPHLARLHRRRDLGQRRPPPAARRRARALTAADRAAPGSPRRGAGAWSSRSPRPFRAGARSPPRTRAAPSRPSPPAPWPAPTSTPATS